MSVKEKIILATLAAQIVAWFATLGAIVWVSIHFILKYW